MTKVITHLLAGCLVVGLLFLCACDDQNTPTDLTTSDSVQATETDETSNSTDEATTDNTDLNSSETQNEDEYELRTITVLKDGFGYAVKDCTEAKSHTVEHVFGEDASMLTVEYFDPSKGKFVPLNYCNHDLAEHDLAWVYYTFRNDNLWALTPENPSTWDRTSPLFPCIFSPQLVCSSGQGAPLAITFTAQEATSAVQIVFTIFTPHLFFGEGTAPAQKIQAYQNDKPIMVVAEPSGGTDEFTYVLSSETPSRETLSVRGDGFEPGDTLRIVFTYLGQELINPEDKYSYNNGFTISDMSLKILEKKQPDK
ncbi:MAG: hypothetical protein IIX85_00460 [Clostridia bacterium]|nr:hypothetical protein [Clostridia bacterium]MBQ2272613.1 hypothetical protein [Clostridia bacterium]MBQ5820758.1 hypothetical protein [Clostridia bacterium]